MRYRIRLSSEKHKTRKLIDVFDHMLPFSELTKKERDIFAEYINGYFELTNRGDLTQHEVFEELFKYEFTRHISNELSKNGEPMSMNSVRNYATKLRKLGMLKDRGINEDFIKLFGSIKDNITFVFEIKN